MCSRPCTFYNSNKMNHQLIILYWPVYEYNYNVSTSEYAVQPWVGCITDLRDPYHGVYSVEISESTQRQAPPSIILRTYLLRKPETREGSTDHEGSMSTALGFVEHWFAEQVAAYHGSHYSKVHFYSRDRLSIKITTNNVMKISKDASCFFSIWECAVPVTQKIHFNSFLLT
jgi:hypothetical protein